MNYLTLPDATELLKQIQSGERSAEGVVSEYLQRLETQHPRINAAVHIFREEALAQARTPQSGPLSGLPISVKETFGLAGETVTAGSMRMPPIPHEQDAEIVRRLREAGAIIIARSNLPEFAMTYESDNLRYGRTNNPLNLDHSPGGSSGGEAALVASGSTVFGVGSDIGGSIRYPAHCCGVVGFKPHSAAINRQGTWPVMDGMIGSMLALGSLTRSVRDARLVYSVIADEPLGEGGDAAAARLHHRPNFRMNVQDNAVASALKRGIAEWQGEGLPSETLDIPEVGPLVQDYISYIAYCLADPFFNLLTTAEGEKLSLAGEGQRQLLRRPTVHKYVFNMLLAAPLIKPNERKALAIEERFTAAREKYYEKLGADGVLILPTSGALAMKHGKAAATVLRPGVPGVFTPTLLINILNLSAISIPSWYDIDRKTGLVPGLMLACRPGSEGVLLDAAARLESLI
ncbi:MAG: amidase [Chloroflexi bacterium]|nr:amidase [Chloroflexota bacterium]